MAADPHETFQLAVVGADGNPVGSAVVLDDRHVITCTHVAAQATTGDKDADPHADIEIKLHTIPWSGGDPITARLLPSACRPKASVRGDRGVRDLAVLELAHPLSGWTVPCEIYPGASVPRQEITLFAFPEAHPDGIRSNIVMIGGLADHWIQIDAAPNAQYRVQPGFSGSPLFDPDTSAVRGIVAAADLGEGRTGFLIPGRAILEFLETIPDLRDLGERLRARAPLDRLPKLPAKLTPRTPLVETIKAMLQSQSVGLVGLRGMGGIGKSVAARLLASDDWVRRSFYDGIEWITVGANKVPQDIQALQEKLLLRLGGRAERDQTLDGMRQAIEKQLAGRHVLLIIDDVWTRLTVRAFQFRAEGCAVIYTSRRRAGFDDCGVAVHGVDLLTDCEARQLFRMHADLPAGSPFSPQVEGILRHCNRHALQIAVAGSMLRRHPTHADAILRRFETANVDKIIASLPDRGEEQTGALRTLSVSYELLQQEERDFLRRLAIFPEDTPIPLAALEILTRTWLDPLACREIATNLDDAALLALHIDADDDRRSTITMHDLQWDFVRSQNTQPVNDHRALVTGLEEEFGGSLFADDERPGGDYFRRFIVHHLIGAGRQDDLFDMLVDPDWIEHRLRAGDQVFDLIADYDRAIASEPRP
jgi:hypothetical protein